MNSRLIDIRSALLGVDPKTGRNAAGDKLDIVNASNPLDLALARGFISEEMHRAAMQMALIYRRAGLRGAGCRVQDYHEVETAFGVKFESFATLPDETVVALFDKVFCEVPAPADWEARAERATDLWAMLMAGLETGVRTQLIEVCILDSWPQWLVYRCAGKAVPPGFAQREAQLLTGLETMRVRLRAARPAKPQELAKPGDRGPVDPAAQRRRKRRMVEERVIYADEDGRAIPMESDETGVAFELYRLRR